MYSDEVASLQIKVLNRKHGAIPGREPEQGAVENVLDAIAKAHRTQLFAIYRSWPDVAELETHRVGLQLFKVQDFPGFM
jgi:hypothetical protein